MKEINDKQSIRTERKLIENNTASRSQISHPKSVVDQQQSTKEIKI